MNGTETLTLKGRFNRVTFALGTVAVLCGLVAAWLLFGLGTVDENTVGLTLAGIFLGGLVVYEAVARRRTEIVLSPEGIRVDEEQIPLTAVRGIIEKDIHRYLKTWVGRFHLRHVRRLEIYTAVSAYPLVIGDEWLTAVDYALAVEWLSAHFTITTETVTEEG